MVGVNSVRGLIGVVLCLAAAICLLVPPAGASAHGPAAALKLRDFEEMTLGAAHAAEHARQRATARRMLRHWRRLSPRERRAARGRARAERAAVIQNSRAQPTVNVGRWTVAPFTLPNFAMNAALLPTGKVAFWSWPPKDNQTGIRPNSGSAALWDPANPGSFKSIPPPLVDPDGPDGPQGLVAAPIACSGQSLQADGSLLVTGGNLAYPGAAGYSNYAGASTVFTFNPWTETWTRQPDMAAGRWYPSQEELADGRTVILAGYTDGPPGGQYSDQLEIFDSNAPEAGRVSTVPSAARTPGLYPHLFTLPDRNLLLAGPNQWDSAILNTQSFTWQELSPMSRYRSGGNAVLLEPGAGSSEWRVLEMGGYDWRDDPGTGNIPPISSTETIKPLTPDPQWTATPSHNVGRSYANTVLLPDGSMVTVGGANGHSAALGLYAVEPNHLRVELYDPATGNWRLGPAQQEYRSYHSTALLLPDGRVWSAGDDFHPVDPQGRPSQTDRAEIYSPPYLFKGSRPQITGAPALITYGQQFTIGVSGRASSAVLMAPGATTHGADMHQRRVSLAVRGITGGLRVSAPSGSGVAPPGYYMLFVLNGSKVPSKARWVKVA